MTTALKTEPRKTTGVGDFLRSLVVAVDTRASKLEQGAAYERLIEHYGCQSTESRGLAMNSGVAGGFLVPEKVHGGVMAAASELAIVRPRSTVVPMATENVPVPVLDPTVVPVAGQPSYYGTFTPVWWGEAQQIPASDPQFGLDELTSHELVGSFAVPDKMVRYSAESFDALAPRIMGGAVAFLEDCAFLSGDGIAKPLGLLNSGARIVTAARSAAGTITQADITSMWTRMLPGSRSRCVWAVSQGAEVKLLPAAGTANGLFNNTTALAQPEPGAAYGLMHRPVLVSEKLPALNSLGDVNLLDLSYYLVGDSETEISASPHFDFRKNLWWFRIVHRVAGMPWVNEPITLADGSTTCSPVVSLGVGS